MGLHAHHSAGSSAWTESPTIARWQSMHETRGRNSSMSQGTAVDHAKVRPAQYPQDRLNAKSPIGATATRPMRPIQASYLPDTR